MKNLRYLFALSLVAGLAACGDDDSGTDPVTDTGTDTADAGVDIGDTDMTDVDDTDVDDTDVDDTDTTPADEICDDEIDNDEDGDADCADSDCADLPVCNPEVCDDADELDEDGDGFANCADSECADDPACQIECDEGQELRGGECVDPIGPDEAIVGDGPFSYINNLQIPPRDSDAACCFDFSGDGVVDNGLAMLVGALGVLGEDLDIDATLQEALEGDDIALIFEWGQGADEAGFHAYLATNDVDDDGTPDDDFATRVAGDGTFQLDPAGVDEFGSIVQFNMASEVDGVVTAGPSQFRLNIPIDTEDFSLDLDLTIEQATVTGELTDVTNGRASVNPEYDVDGEMVEFGGLQLGGVVPLDQIGELLNTLASDCACAGFDDTMPVITYGDDGVQYNLACAQTPAGECTEADGVVCENLSLVCSFLPSLPSLGLNDIDTNNNGVGDALSVGIRLSATGAIIADPAFPADE